MSLCRRCIIRLEAINHGDDGLCELCQEQAGEPKASLPWDQGRVALAEALARYQGKGRDYDVLVPLTGGKDSVFALHCVTTLAPDLRVLAFTWDHGFHEQQSWRNMEGIVARTGVDHEVFRFGGTDEPPTLVHLAFHKVFGLPCVACMKLQSPVVYRAALEHGAALTVWGDIKGQSGDQSTEAIRTGQAQAIAERLLGGADAWHRLMAETGFRDADEVARQLLAPFRSARDDGSTIWPHYLMLGSFLDWNQAEEAVTEELRARYGFRKPQPMTTHTSCELIGIRGHHERTNPRHTIGPDGSEQPAPSLLEAELASLVRSGAISREQAVNELDLLGFSTAVPTETIQHYARRMGITIEQYHELSRGGELPDWAAQL